MSIENKKYSIYLLKYLGVGLVAGSVVHVGTLSNGFLRYIVLGIIGLLCMVIGNLIEAKLTGEKIGLRYFIVITGLSLFTGFFSGGIQHYLDNPSYAGILLATGLSFSYVLFFIKDKTSLLLKNVLMVFLIGLGIFVFSTYVYPKPQKPHSHTPLNSIVENVTAEEEHSH